MVGLIHKRTILSVSPSTVAGLIHHADVEVLDVRRPGEFQLSHIENAVNIPPDDINKEIASLNKQKKYVVHCAGGYRSMIFLSILRSRGFENLTAVQGGFKALREDGRFSLSWANLHINSSCITPTLKPVTDEICRTGFFLFNG